QVDGKYSGAARLFGLPYYEDNGRRLVHLGVSYAFRNATSSQARFRSQPESHLAQNFVDTASFPINYVNELGLEAAAVFGPIYFQGEFVGAEANAKSGIKDAEFFGFYVMGSYVLTGESRPYRPAYGVFDRVKPKNNFLDGKGSLGAWEVAARYSFIDLD